MNKKLKYQFVSTILECSKSILEEDSGESDEELVIDMLNLGKNALLLPERLKRLWVKQWREDRPRQGAHAFLSKKLKLDPPSYTNYLRLNVKQFHDLLSVIRNDIARTDTVMRNAVTPAEKLSLTLRFLATGEKFQNLSYNTRLSPAFICRTIPQVCKALIKHLSGKYLKMTSCAADWEAISMEFAIKWQFPNCLGALDGKHINFRPPRNEGAFFHNYKGTNSIILLALVDANCRFIFVDIGCNGRTNDAGALLQSPLKKILDEGKNLPHNTLVGRDRCLPHVVVADDAFPLQRNLLKPYPYHTNDAKKRIFNIRLSRARHVVEHAFGILANRFRVFQTIINLKVETVEVVTFPCCVLHNFLLAIDSTYINSCEVTEKKCDGEISRGPYNPRKGEAERIRQQFMSYFSEEGEVDWQYSKL